MPKLMGWGLSLLGVFALLLAANTCGRMADLSFGSDTPEARLAQLSPYWRVLSPEGPISGGAILLSGCDGVRDNMLFWAEEFVRDGRVALILDSHTPRGLDRLELWRLVCAGQILDGGARAGDLAVALSALSGEADVDGDVVILGASHGGWTAMEFVARAVTEERLPDLTRWPAPPEVLIDRVSGLVLLYPYCGILNRAGVNGWRKAPATLMILAEKDSIVDTEACRDRAESLEAGGGTIETVTIRGADHGFDQREKALFSTLAFDAAQRDAALADFQAFLERLD